MYNTYNIHAYLGYLIYRTNHKSINYLRIMSQVNGKQQRVLAKFVDSTSRGLGCHNYKQVAGTGRGGKIGFDVVAT